MQHVISSLPNSSLRRPRTAGLLVLAVAAAALVVAKSGMNLTRPSPASIDNSNIVAISDKLVAGANPVVDLRHADFHSKNVIDLGQGWKPENYQGTAIYHARLLLPTHQRSFALKFSEISGHALIYVNGELIREAGGLDTEANETVAAGRHIYTSFFTENPSADLTIQVTNLSAPVGGITGSVKIGSPESIASLRTRGFMLDGLVISIMLFMFFYHLCDYAIQRRGVSNLWFSLFSLLVLIRTTLVGEANFAEEVLHLGDTWSWRAELVTYYLSLPVLTEFMNALFPNENKRRYTWLTLWLVVPFTMLTVMTEPKIFAPAKIAVQIAQVALSVVYLRGILKAVAHKRPGAKPFLVGFTMLASLSLLEVMALYNGWDVPRLSNLGAVGFAAMQSIILAKGYTDAFYAAEASERSVRRLHTELLEQENNRLELTRIQAEKSMLKSSLAEAQAFSSAMGDAISFVPELQIASVVKSAEVAGGDWLGIEYDDMANRAFLAIADVTGHDMLSALVTVTAIGTFRGAVAALRAQPSADAPEYVVKHLVQSMNDAVRKAGQKSERLMTMAVILIDFTTGETYYCNSGHTPLLMVSNSDVKA
ncbi:MAG: hypothetical protein RL011_1169, partial [Pseudomonadota bacterium]